MQDDKIEKKSKNLPLDFSIGQHQFEFALFQLPFKLFQRQFKLRRTRNKNRDETVTDSRSDNEAYHGRRHWQTLFFVLDLPGWNFLSVCLVWISMRSSSPASAFICPFWFFFFVPVGPECPTVSFGLGPFFFPGGRPEFWDVFKEALARGEPGNCATVRPRFCWKMSYWRKKNTTTFTVQNMRRVFQNRRKNFILLFTIYLNQTNLLGQVLH